MTAEDVLVERLIRDARYAEQFSKAVADDLREAADAITILLERERRLSQAVQKIVDHESHVSESHMECENCHDAFLDDYSDVRAFARAALTREGG